MTYPVQPPEPPAIFYSFPSHIDPKPMLGFEDDSATLPTDTPPQTDFLEEETTASSGLDTPVKIATEEPSSEAEQPDEVDSEPISRENLSTEEPSRDTVVKLSAVVKLPAIPERTPEHKAEFPHLQSAIPNIQETSLESSGFSLNLPLPEPQPLLPEVATPLNLPQEVSNEPPTSDEMALDGETQTPHRYHQVAETGEHPITEAQQIMPSVASKEGRGQRAEGRRGVFGRSLYSSQKLFPLKEEACTLVFCSTLSSGETATSEISAVGSLPQFSRDSRLLNAQNAPTPVTPSFNWVVMPSAPTQDTSFRLLIPPVPPAVDGVALQPSPLVNPPVEVTADLQQFEEERRIFTAEGNVVLRYQGTVIDADWLQVNLRSRQGIGEGHVSLTQVNRVLRGDRFRYNFAQDSGTVYGVRGDVNIANTPTPNPTLPSDVSVGGQPRLLSDRLLAAQPVEVLPSAGGFVGTIGAGRGNNPSGTTGTLSRLRFEAEEVNFYPRGWEGRGVRITNDPFGPELELRSDRATLTRLSPLQDELVLDNPRLVFDDGFALPLLRRRYRIDRRERDPALIQFGYDRRDRGGFYVFRDFEVLSRQGFRLTLTPQYYIQRGFDRRNLLSLRELGLIAKAEANFTPNTSLTAVASFTNLDPETFDPDGDPFDNDDGDLRASVRLAQNIPTRLGLHTLTTEYSYRDRLFNGSLGFRTIHQSAGLLFTSPNILLGKSGINLSYQAGYNWVEADTDRLDLLEPIRENNRINMGRFQTSFALNKGIFLWRGTPLPATPTEGLRFSPTPIVPFVQVFFGVRGIGSFYTRSDPALGLTGTVGIQGQFGHFAKKFLDYSAFSISYSGTLRDGQSPFLFDRIADRSILGLSFTQQLYGPLRVGIATAINLEESDAFSTDYTLEYSRRSYGLILRYNPQRELGSFTLRISDFNWQGGTEPFTPIDGGIRRD